MSEVILQKLTKQFGNSAAVDNISLNIRSGELVTLLGPSGCGKTTTLRMIGGFIRPTSGHILVGGRNVTDLPPNLRNMGFGFQNYALFPHMTVAANVAFGLEMRRIKKVEIRNKVNAALDRVRLREYAERLPKELSGGQQQRVALARALVIEPDVLLLDEPLSNLDANLRQGLKNEIREIQQSMGITTVFVTHDQDEALSVSDRVVVMRDGRVEQSGTPDEIFDTPGSQFVAEFMGVTNILSGRSEGAGTFRVDSGDLVPAATTAKSNGEVVMALRPERIQIAEAKEAAGEGALKAKVGLVTYRGLVIDYLVHTESGLVLTARRQAPVVGGPKVLPQGQDVRLSWQSDAGVLVPATRAA